MRLLFSPDSDHGVGLLAAANLSLAGLQTFLSSLQPILHTMLSVGQVAVAAVTVYYIWRKARAVKVKPARKRKEKQ